MYLGIDIGGTKTLIAVLDNNGVIKEEVRFPTPHDYHEFLDEVRNNLAIFDHKDFAAGGAGITASRFDRETDIAIRFGNLPWRNVAIRHDLEKISNCPMVVENDAKLSALSEAMLRKDKYSSVLYVTVSTGIGYGLVVNGVIDKNIGDGGGRTIMLDYKGKLTSWEDFASGRAIVEEYGKQAKDIEDEETWREISRNIAKGFVHLIAITQPEVIVIGGGVGNHFEKFHHFLSEEIERYQIPLIKLPVLSKAKRPDQAVIYGCYDIAKQVYPHAQSYSKT